MNKANDGEVGLFWELLKDHDVFAAEEIRFVCVGINLLKK
jgi:hypothetical protein